MGFFLSDVFNETIQGQLTVCDCLRAGSGRGRVLGGGYVNSVMSLQVLRRVWFLNKGLSSCHAGRESSVDTMGCSTTAVPTLAAKQTTTSTPVRRCSGLRKKESFGTSLTEPTFPHSNSIADKAKKYPFSPGTWSFFLVNITIHSSGNLNEGIPIM